MWPPTWLRALLCATRSDAMDADDFALWSKYHFATQTHPKLQTTERAQLSPVITHEGKTPAFLVVCSFYRFKLFPPSIT